MFCASRSVFTEDTHSLFLQPVSLGIVVDRRTKMAVNREIMLTLPFN